MTDYNFYHVSCKPAEIDMLFGSFEEDEKVFTFTDNDDMSDLAVAAGFFPSRNQAKKNNWHGAIRAGWQSTTFGKKQHRVFIWNPRRDGTDDYISHAGAVISRDEKIKETVEEVFGAVEVPDGMPTVVEEVA